MGIGGMRCGDRGLRCGDRGGETWGSEGAAVDPCPLPQHQLRSPSPEQVFAKVQLSPDQRGISQKMGKTNWPAPKYIGG